MATTALRYEKKLSLSSAAGHTTGVTAVAFSPSGTLLATSGLDSKVCIWNISNGELVHTFVASSAVFSLEWSGPQDSILLCGTREGDIFSLAVAPSTLRAGSLLPGGTPHCDGPRLASGAQKEVSVWERSSANGRWGHLLDLPSPSTNSNNEDREVLATSVHWTQSKDHSSILLVTYLYHGYVLYNTYDWSTIHTIPLNGVIASASVTVDGRMMAVSNMTSGFDVYEIGTNLCLGKVSHPVDKMVAVPVCFLHGGNAIVGGSMVGEVHLWNAMTFHKHQTLRLREGDIILAIAAHYDDTHDRFMIATGVINADVEHAVTLWCTEDSTGKQHKRWFPWSQCMAGPDCVSFAGFLLMGLLTSAVVLSLGLSFTGAGSYLKLV